MHPKHLSINDFSYNLPDNKIAAYPLPERDSSKLLIYKNGNISENIFKHLDEYIPEDSLLIFNNTKVIEARLIFEKSTGSDIEIFCLDPHESYKDYATALQQKGKVLWNCLIGGAKKWKSGNEYLHKKINIDQQKIMLTAKKMEQQQASFLIEFEWNNPEISFAEILHFCGSLPLPPYLNREAEQTDYLQYQTVYARHKGSVAAPTAGLHFTETLLDSLKKKNIHQNYVTLHVGAGTFMPVKSEKMSEHIMHSELIEVEKTLINSVLENLENNILAVGTT
ncbi:MAG: S-adenosylmethionine:tRNA ribosyltransferase-isomerase, partial [Chitinophagaceae bacterium]|nr:S-adenosylmethionine:tRNA ribosyltransferase-isomerase [Chitinophagaceae bacterium]